MVKQKYHHGDLKNALVQAGLELLAEQGVEALSLRQVAGRAGVSHSAPYAHFADKQALIAAISTEGFRRLYECISQSATVEGISARDALLEAACAYTQFAIDSPALFKLMFSGSLENESAYSDFVHLSRLNFQLLQELVQNAQAAGVLRPGPTEVMAISIWSLAHGFTALLLERQISHHILEKMSRVELLHQVLEQVMTA
jgi:AcrR family transcriptional regulator